MTTIAKSFNVLEDELRRECLKRSLNLFEEIRSFILETPAIEIIPPSSIEQIILSKQGRPKWGDVRTADGWREFFLYAKLLDERYSIYPHTLFEPKKTNKYYINNIIALRENGGAPRLKRQKIESMDNFAIMESFMSIDDMAVPQRRALNFCFPTELIGLSANSNEHHKALEAELKMQEKKENENQKIDLPPAVNEGKTMTVDELTAIMNENF